MNGLVTAFHPSCHRPNVKIYTYFQAKKPYLVCLLIARIMYRFLFAFVWLLGGTLCAQNLTLTGTFTNATGLPLEGVSVGLRLEATDSWQMDRSNAHGQFTFTHLRKGNYTLKASYFGQPSVEQQIVLADSSVQIGAWVLPDATLLKAVEIKEKVPTSVQRGDTTELNTAAFKVMKDATAEELLEKMPTVTSENGQVKVQGEAVEQVLVDGRPFFGSDATAALRNLPAELIEKVQIYDAQSDQANFTRFNTGNTRKTINLVTKKAMRRGQFGRMYAGYGYADKYQAGENMNVFRDEHRLSIVSMANNLNIRNFNEEDILGAVDNATARPNNRQNNNNNPTTPTPVFSPPNGITTTQAVGINFNTRWKEQRDLAISYFFNNANRSLHEVLHRQLLNGAHIRGFYEENNQSDNRNNNHRLNARLSYRFNETHTLLWQPRFTTQLSGSRAQAAGNTVLAEVPYNQTQNRRQARTFGYNYSQSLLYQFRFPKKGRTASVDFTAGRAPKSGNNDLQAVNTFFNRVPARVDSLQQQGQSDGDAWNVGANVEYTEPLNQRSQLLLQYRITYQQQASERLTYTLDRTTQLYDDLNERLSNVFSNDYRTQATGLAYNYATRKHLNFSVRLNTQWATLGNTQEFPLPATVGRTFFNVLPSASLRYVIGKNRNLRFNYNSNTQLPAVNQLQNVLNNFNPLLLSTGNAELRQSEGHTFFVRYQSSSPAKSTLFFWMVGGGFTRDYIGRGTWLPDNNSPFLLARGLPTNTQLTMPINLNGYRTLNTVCTYGLPIKALRSNLNIDVSFLYNRTPGLVNDALNFAQIFTLSGGFTLGSNISDQLDFTLSMRPSWQRGLNSVPTFPNTQFFNPTSRFQLKWQVYKGIVLRNDLRHVLYAGLSDGFNQQYWLWNLGIGKKIGKQERGELTLLANDLLNQNRTLQRTVTEAYIEDSQSNTLTRFVMLSFTYQLRQFKGATPPLPESERPNRERRGDGMRRREKF